ncbi:MAG: AAA family ATPase, partial [Candidatus Omnitrophica bacterium]|nr:AAA family ATPase [Candidatus Omnitrophota bacterium]
WISKLKIQNFKSIENEEIQFNKGLSILVGPNNAGKSNIMEAIDTLLGDIYLPNFEPTTDHFFNGDENREIIIEAELNSDGDDLSKIDDSFTNQVSIRFKYSKNNGGCFEVLLNNQWSQKYNKPFGYYWDFEKKLFFLRVKSLRNIMEIAPIRWKSPLKYFKEMIIKKSPQDKLNGVIQEIDYAKSKLSEIQEVKDILEALISISRDQTDIKNIIFSPASTKYSDVLNDMKILIDDGYISEVNKKGLGTQNLIIISLFRVMAKYMRDEEHKFIIYGIDEPEIGLHPHSQRQLVHSLKKLSAYSQVIITTHSDRLVDVSEVDNIIRIGKEENKTKHYLINLTHQEKKILEVHGRNLNEVFFAKRCLIVEGDTEEGFFPEVSKKVIEKTKEGNRENEENYSFDYNSVSIINGRGDTIWFFIRLLKNLNIPFVVLIDNDKLSNNRDSFLQKLIETNLIKEEEKSNLKRLDEESLIGALKNHNIFVLPPFEKVISEHSNGKILKKIMNAIKFVKENWGYEINDADFEIDNENLENLKEKVYKLLKENKRWRIGKAIAQELMKEEIPKPYIEIIKKVSKL